MISNERKWPSHLPSRQPYQSYQSHGSPPPPRPFVPEDTLASKEIQIERKLFLLMLKENPRGRFLRISEDVGGRRNSIIIPATGLGEFYKLLGEILKAAGETPKQKPAESPHPAGKL